MSQQLLSPLRPRISQRRLQRAGISLTEEDFNLNEKPSDSPIVEPFCASKLFNILSCYVNVNKSQDMSIGL